MDTAEFYKQLGNLMYAIANSDGMVTQSELEKLKEVVTTYLIPKESSKDIFGTEKAFSAEIEFDDLLSQSLTADEAFDRFTSYFENHEHEVDEKTMKLIHQIAVEIAKVHSHENSSEIDYLNKLDEMFQISDDNLK